MTRPSRRALLLPLAAIALTLPPTAPLAAANTCDKVGETLGIAISGSAGISVDLNGQIIVRINGAQQDCGDASNMNISGIFISGGNGNDQVLLDQSGPGGELNDGIVIFVGLGEGMNTLAIRGTQQRDRIGIGILRMDDGQTIDVIDRNGDGAPDMDLQDIGVVSRLPSGGGDIVSGMALRGTVQRTSASSAPTLGPARIPLVLKGGPGNDKLTGGNGKDKLIGGTGNDKLKGGKGKDKLNGGKGTNDRCNGGPGRDTDRGCE